jgi:hypothetical protein
MSLEYDCNQNEYTFIVSDSQAALTTLRAIAFNYKLVDDCLDALKSTETRFIGPDPFFGNNNTVHKTEPK